MSRTTWIMGGLAVALGVTACGDSEAGADQTDGASNGAATGPTAGPASTTSTPTSGDPTAAPGGTGGVGGTAGGETADAGTDAGGTDGDDGPPVAPPCPYEPVEGNPEFVFEVVAYGFQSLPVQVVGDPTQPDRLFVPTVFGPIIMLEPGQEEAGAPWLDLTERVRVFQEGGMLGMEFHHDYPDDPRFYVFYAAQPDGNARIEEFVIDPDTLAPPDPDSGRTVLELFNDQGSHYGGMMHFDADGWLTVSIGDGADSVSPLDPRALHSKFIRIGVEPDGVPDDPLACAGCPRLGPFDYTIPPDNPFVGDDAYAPEVWAMGFRNPWRWYFDDATGDIFAGDVGLSDWEEMNIVRRGEHYGWSDLEGNNCFGLPGCELVGPGQVSSDGYTAPLVDYSHDPACAVIGGPVYTSCEVPAWNGIVFYGDMCASGISALRWENDQLEDLGVVFPANIGPRGSGTNAWGDVFFTGGIFAGEIYRLVPGR